MNIENPYAHPIGKITVNLIDLRDNLFNIQELEANKCIVNFKGRHAEGLVEPRAPLVLECPIKEIIDLINQLK